MIDDFRPHLPPPSPQATFRAALGRFPTGVAVVTFDGAERRHGLTVNSFTSVSMDPPLVLVSIGRRARSHDELAGRPFAVNVLGAEQQHLALHFAGGRQSDVPWVTGAHAPRLAGVLAHFSCLPWAAYDGGDHTLFVGQVVDSDYRDGEPLAFSASRFTGLLDLSLGHEHLL